MVSKTSSRPVFLSVEEAAGLITDGSLIAIGGRMEMEPMAFVRTLVRHRKKDLRLVTVPGGGLAVDMLIGAGCVKSVETPQIGLNEFGQAPHFRRSVQDGEMVVLDQVWPAILSGLRAGAMGIPFMPVRGILGSDYLKVQPRFKVIRCPFTGHEIVVVEAIKPDYTVIHASKADSRGNVLIQKQSDVDLAVEASQVAIATVEEIVEEGALAADENSRLMSWINFHIIAHTPYGAHPTGCQEHYPVDSEHVKRYIEMAASKELFEAYLQKYIFSPADGTEYMKLVTAEASTAK